MKLYHYWRSTSSWRVRWALIIKGVKVEYVPVDLLTDESERPEHLARNPMGYVPVLEISERGERGKSHYLRESTAIIEWLEEMHPKPALLPKDPYQRAHARMLGEIVNSGIQPLQNLTVAEHLSPDTNVRKAWAQHWIRRGLKAYEELVQSSAGQLSIGDDVSYPDLFLIPQCYAAVRNEVSLDEFPTIARIHENAMKLPSAQAAHPDSFKPSG
jgi:maleylpyruvate isomerase